MAPKLDKARLVPVLEMMGYSSVDKETWRMFSKVPNEYVVWGVDFKKGEVFKWIEDHREYEVPDDPTFMELKNLVESINGGEQSSFEAPTADQSAEAKQEEKLTSEEKASPSYQNNDTQPAVKPEEKPAAGQRPSALLSLIHEYVEDDILEIFGDTGSGKSGFARAVALEAIASGKKVYYLDTERNLTKADIAAMKGCQYKYTPELEEIKILVKKLPETDVVILDSVGFPILTAFADMTVKERGDALLAMISIFGALKKWAHRNKGFVVVTNQPESEFNKEKGHILRPFGDKSQFAAKEIWKTEIVDRKPAYTNIRISAFRSRSVGHRTKIAEMKITSNGVEVA